MRRIFAAFSAIAFFMGTPAVHAGLNHNLIGYWQFNGDGRDSSPGQRNLDLIGSPGFDVGLFGEALDLHNDYSQYAARPIDDPEYNFGSRDFSIQIWVNYNTVSLEQNLMEKFQGTDGPGWTLTSLLAAGESATAHFAPAGGPWLYSDRIVDFPAGVWHHFLARRNFGQFDLFLDGALVASETGRPYTSLIDTSMPLLFGRRNSEDVRDFSVDGRLDEAAIWDRALSDAEVASLYNGGRGREIVPEPATWLLGIIGAGVALVVARKQVAG